MIYAKHRRCDDNGCQKTRECLFACQLKREAVEPPSVTMQSPTVTADELAFKRAVALVEAHGKRVVDVGLGCEGALGGHQNIKQNNSLGENKGSQMATPLSTQGRDGGAVLERKESTCK